MSKLEIFLSTISTLLVLNFAGTKFRDFGQSVFRRVLARFSTPYVKSLQINFVSQQNIQNGTDQ